MVVEAAAIRANLFKATSVAFFVKANLLLEFILIFLWKKLWVMVLKNSTRQVLLSKKSFAQNFLTFPIII